MVAMSLSEGQVEAGQALLNRLDDDGVRVDAALWFYFPEKENWKLVLSLPDAIRLGPKAAYKEVQRVLSGAKDPVGLDLADVAVARPNSDILNRFRGAVRVGPGKSAIRFSKCVFNGLFVEDALVYRLMRSSREARSKKTA